MCHGHKLQLLAACFVQTQGATHLATQSNGKHKETNVPIKRANAEQTDTGVYIINEQIESSMAFFRCRTTQKPLFLC